MQTIKKYSDIISELGTNLAQLNLGRHENALYPAQFWTLYYCRIIGVGRLPQGKYTLISQQGTIEYHKVMTIMTEDQ